MLKNWNTKNVDAKLIGVGFKLIFFTIKTINKNKFTNNKINQDGRDSIIKLFVTIKPWDWRFNSQLFRKR